MNALLHLTSYLLPRLSERTTRDQDRDLLKMNSSALESRDLGLEITTLGLFASIGGGRLGYFHVSQP